MAGIVNLNPENFRALIRRHGEPVVWSRGVPCNCYRPGSAAPPQSCGLCEQGLRYTQMPLDPAVRAYIGAMTRSMVDAELGLITAGTTTIAAMFDELPLSQGDKIMLPRRVVQFSDVLTRGESETDELPRRPVVAISLVQQVDLETMETTTFNVGTDYQLDDDALRWLPGGDAPAPGSDYSIVFRHRPTYWFLGELQQEAPPSQYGDTFLPFYGALVLKHPFEGNV